MKLLIYKSVIGRVNAVRNLPTMTSLQLRFVYQRQAVFLNLHYVAETWFQSIRMEVCLRGSKATWKVRTIAQLGLDRNNSASPSDVTIYWNSRNAREMREGPRRASPSNLAMGAWTKIGLHVKLAANFTWNLLIKANYESIFCLPLHTIKSPHSLKQLKLGVNWDPQSSQIISLRDLSEISRGSVGGGGGVETEGGSQLSRGGGFQVFKFSSHNHLL